MSYLFIPWTSLKAYLLLVKSAAELFVNRLGAIGTVLGFVIDILNIASKCAGSDFVAVLEAYIFPTLALLAIMAAGSYFCRGLRNTPNGDLQRLFNHL
jgi:hypothetical protein